MRTVSISRLSESLLLSVLGLAALGACSSENGQENAVEETRKVASVSTDSEESAAPGVYAYSMLAPGTGSSPVIFTRIIYDALNQTCPVLSGDDGSTLSTVVRPRNPIRNGATVTDTNFPVTVCEAVMRADVAYSNSQDGISLHAVTLQPGHVQVYGDSGCKEADCPGASASTQFQTLAGLGAGQPHDLILHVGDYNYRGTSGHFAGSGHNKIWAYDAGDVPNPQPSCTYNDIYYSQNASNSPKPDAWKYWKADFFDAAKNPDPSNDLLPTAPWVFARGNHELCSRAGVGWFYFFGPGSSLTGSGMSQKQCPDQGDFNNPPTGAGQQIEMIDPYMLTLSDFQIWVMDSANACDTGSDDPLTAQYKTQYLALAAKTNNNIPTWVMSHRPVWGYQTSGPINTMLQTGLQEALGGTMPGPVTLSLAGHMHIYESLTFFDYAGNATGRPPQIVIGNSGVSLGSAPGEGSDTGLDGQTAQYNSAATFGYLQMTIGSGSGWSGQVSAEDNSAIVTCDSTNPANGQLICQ